MLAGYMAESFRQKSGMEAIQSRSKVRGGGAGGAGEQEKSHRGERGMTAVAFGGGGGGGKAAREHGERQTDKRPISLIVPPSLKKYLHMIGRESLADL